MGPEQTWSASRVKLVLPCRAFTLVPSATAASHPVSCMLDDAGERRRFSGSRCGRVRELQQDVNETCHGYETANT
eukprot:748504-Hanusia_phi.AAC.1